MITLYQANALVETQLHGFNAHDGYKRCIGSGRIDPRQDCER